MSSAAFHARNNSASLDNSSSALSSFDSPLSSVLSSGNSSFCPSEYSSTPPESTYFLSPVSLHGPQAFSDSFHTPISLADPLPDDLWTAGLPILKPNSDRKQLLVPEEDFGSQHALSMTCGDANKVESFVMPGIGLSVHPTSMVECPSETLHNRIFERGETMFGFLKEDCSLFVSSVHEQQDPFLAYHFPRKKLDIDLRVMPTVYLEDKTSSLTMEVSCSQPFTKLVVRSAAYGLPFDGRIHPCIKCQSQHHKLFVSVSSFSDYGQIYEDEVNQTSTLYLNGDSSVNSLRMALHYNCTQDHIKNGYKFNQRVLANTLTVIEVFDSLSDMIGRFTFRIRIVASPGRDLLKFLTNHLTPRQTGCILGKCSHLGARWKLDKFKNLEPEAIKKCLERFVFKENVYRELDDLLTKSRKGQKRKAVDLIDFDLTNTDIEGTEMADDTCLVVRCKNQAKMARIKEIAERIIKEPCHQNLGMSSAHEPVSYSSEMIKREASSDEQLLAFNHPFRGQVLQLITGEKIITIK